MRTSNGKFLFLPLLLLALVPAAIAQNKMAVPFPSAATPPAVDLGELTAQPAAEPVTFTLALRLNNVSEAENLVKSLHTPGDPLYHQFLSASEFAARFAPSDADVAKVIASLAKYGLSASRTTATTLSVTGSAANVERAFSVSLHGYAVAAHDGAPAYTYHAPLNRSTIPSEVSPAVAGVVGLDSRPAARPLSMQAPHAAPVAAPAQPAKSGPITDPFESLTVADFASYYDVLPLYERGLTGRGRKLGIVTLASFTPSDAFAYWSALNLKVHPNRITVINVDGGPGAPSDASGSLETTIDVEQSGGIAPGAKVLVYQAPNTNQAFVDAFAQAIDDDTAETISCSWGAWEWLQNAENSPVTDPITGQPSGVLESFHELFIRAAIQGQTLYSASGDGGAYDINHDLGCFPPYSSTNLGSCNLTLTVDNPASDPYMTAAGGTTLPGTISLCLNAACTSLYNIKHEHERVWGWDYFLGFCAAIGLPDPVACGVFPAGSGGGVSVIFGLPFYQFFLEGTQLSQPDQVFQIPPAVATADEIESYFALPAYFPGRNVPDVSFNADPYTGYAVYYTSDVTGFGIQTGWGGTSFVGPQLNGVSALFGEDLHSRIGLLNFPLYALAHSGRAYSGPHAPLNIISHGDNWFYHGRDGYSPAVGLGTMDVANFDRYLQELF